MIALSLTRNGDQVWQAVDDRDSRTLAWIDRTLCTEDGDYKLDVIGPMTSYTLARRAPKFWVLESSRLGFA